MVWCDKIIIIIIIAQFTQSKVYTIKEQFGGILFCTCSYNNLLVMGVADPPISERGDSNRVPVMICDEILGDPIIPYLSTEDPSGSGMYTNLSPTMSRVPDLACTKRPF